MDELDVKRLSLRTMLLYSVASAGTNMVAAFTNAGLPLYLVPYGLPGWSGCWRRSVRASAG